jgi:hypothetical protein
MRKRRIDPTRVIVGLIIFLVCVFGLFGNSGKQGNTLPRAQFSDRTPLGGRGLALMLEKLGYTVNRQRAGLQKMPADAKIWLILDPQTRFSKREEGKLLNWVRQGGTLLFCVRPANDYSFVQDKPSEGIEALQTALSTTRSEGDVPHPDAFLPGLTNLSLDTVSAYRSGVKIARGSSRVFTVSRPHLEIADEPGGNIARIEVGKGQVFVLPDALLLTNYALAKADNAVLVSNLLRLDAPSGAVYFDERQSGADAVNTEADTLLSYLRKPPVSYAVWQLFFAALLFWAFAGRRLGSPVSLPGSGPVTRASQFAAAMGGLFSKTNRPQAAAQLIGNRFRRRLAQRLGLSPAESDAVLARRAQEIAGIPFEITDRLLLQSQAPPDTMGEALRDAQEMETVLRKLEGRD